MQLQLYRELQRLRLLHAVPLERRDDYMRALESASVKHDVGPFASFVGGLVRGRLEGGPTAAIPTGPG